MIDDENVSRKHAEVRPSGGSWIVRDLGSTNGVKVNGRRSTRVAGQSLKGGDRIEIGLSALTFEQSMTLDPVAVALKFGFLAVLYLFLLWVARSALRDLRSTRRRRVPDYDQATGMHPPAARRARRGEPRLRVNNGAGLRAGAAYDMTQGAMLGRGDEADIRLEDEFSSSRHARLVPHGDVLVLEDLGSTNGTYLNGEAVSGPQPLHTGTGSGSATPSSPSSADHAARLRAVVRLRRRPPAPGQRGQLLRPVAAVRRRRRHGRRAGGRGRVRDGGRGVRGGMPDGARSGSASSRSSTRRTPHPRASRSDAAHQGMGTTRTAVYVDEDEVVLAHVGDSRGYLFRDGDLTRLTHDHSLVGELVDRGRLTEEQAESTRSAT